MNVAVLLAYVLAIVLLIGTPGPIVALVIISGVIALDAHSLQWISLLGCGFIAWMALHGLRAELAQQHPVKSAPLMPVKGRSGFFNGFFLGVSNPKDIVFFVAFFPQFIGITPDLDLSLIILTLSWILLDFLTLSVVYLGFQRLSRSQLYPHLLGLCGLILLMVALYGIYSIFS